MTIGNLTWDSAGKHYYYTGIDGVALCVDNGSGWYSGPVAWNGVTAVNESPSGAESNKLYADNIEYLNLLSKEEFGCTVECYQVPEAFYPCDGMVSKLNGAFLVHGQPRKSFCLIYRVQKGSDTVEAGGAIEGSSYGNGYIYHIVYGCKAAPSSRDFGTVNDSPEAQTFSYEINTIAITDATKMPTVSGVAAIKAVAHIEIDGSTLTNDPSTETGHPANGSIQKLESVLYGSTCPTPAEIAEACGYTDSNG